MQEIDGLTTFLTEHAIVYQSFSNSVYQLYKIASVFTPKHVIYSILIRASIAYLRSILIEPNTKFLIKCDHTMVASLIRAMITFSHIV